MLSYEAGDDMTIEKWEKHPRRKGTKVGTGMRRCCVLLTRPLDIVSVTKWKALGYTLPFDDKHRVVYASQLMEVTMRMNQWFDCIHDSALKDVFKGVILDINEFQRNKSKQSKISKGNQTK